MLSHMWMSLVLQLFFIAYVIVFVSVKVKHTLIYDSSEKILGKMFALIKLL